MFRVGLSQPTSGTKYKPPGRLGTLSQCLSPRSGGFALGEDGPMWPG